MLYYIIIMHLIPVYMFIDTAGIICESHKVLFCQYNFRNQKVVIIQDYHLIQSVWLKARKVFIVHFDSDNCINIYYIKYYNCMIAYEKANIYLTVVNYKLPYDGTAAQQWDD